MKCSCESSSAHAFAIVNVDPGTHGIMLPYQASLFAMHQRLKETGGLSTADHVLLVKHIPGANPGFEEWQPSESF